jgi:hypothetical protein
LRNQLPSELKSEVVRRLFKIISDQGSSFDALAKAIRLSSGRVIYYRHNEQKFLKYDTLAKMFSVIRVDLNEVLNESLL